MKLYRDMSTGERAITDHDLSELAEMTKMSMEMMMEEYDLLSRRQRDEVKETNDSYAALVHGL